MRERSGLLDAAELGNRLGEIGAGLTVVDMRDDRDDPRPRIPGSVWAGLHEGFAQLRPDRNLAYDLPTPEEFATTLAGLGAAPDTEIVLLDDSGNRRATRVYWLLRYYCHRGPVSVLDGGLRAYLRAGLPTAPEFVVPVPGEYPAPAGTDESIRATADEIARGLDGGEINLCDVRTPEEYGGEVAMSGRAGHLPGAVHIPWETALAPDGTFLPNDRLAGVLQPFLEPAGQPITYCQGGIRASLTWFSLEVLLRRPAKLYAASWEEWAQRPELPAELPA
jgi:thiosulfate/3-mercaptopyruvate sulfurtransferase